MASVLASQLAQLSALKGPQEKWVRGKASLLFDYQQAADVGADTLLSIAQTGELRCEGRIYEPEHPRDRFDRPYRRRRD
jgi:hypothetical protein